MALNSCNSRQLSRREKLLITALFAVSLLACLVKLGGVSTLEAIRELYFEQSLIRSELKLLDAVIAREQQITAEYLESKPDRQRLEQFIPKAEQHPAAIGELEKLINSGPGRLLAMRVSENIDYDGYSAHNIHIKIGSLNAFPGDLIRQLEDFQQLLVIEQIEWQDEDNDNGIIFISLNLYFLN